MSVKKKVTYKSLDLIGEETGLNPDIFLEVIDNNSGNYLIHKDILRHHVLKQQGTVSTKTRSEVRGGGKKPWRQKGTGRARAGSNTSPLWKGGGVIFGPKPKLKKHKLNKKERRLALRTLLYNKTIDISTIRNLETALSKPTTKEFSNICKNCDINLTQKVLVIVKQKTQQLKLSVRNIKNVELISVSNLNTLSLIKAKQIIFTPLAVDEFKRRKKLYSFQKILEYL